MHTHFLDRWNGPINGPRLPLTAWSSLQDEGITTLDQLKAVADRLEGLVGIGPKTAQVIREELARISAPEEQTSGKL
ncbi:hypothetical protein AAII07_54360 [Microvirga sp. 0TCS3.31]